MENSQNSFLQGFRDGIPIGLGYLSVSITFGMMAMNLGLPLWAAVLISITNLTSAGQFAGIALMAAAAPLAEMALTQLVINIRYSLMSLAISQKADSTLTTLHRFFVSFFVTDEIFALATGQPKKVGRRYLYGLSIAPLCGWTGGTFIGAAASSLLPASLRSALSIAIYGMFIAIILPPAKKHHPIWAVLAVSIGLSCLFTWAPYLNQLSNGFSMILCALIASAFGAIFFPVKEDEQ